jgi:hypothetical protein
MKKMCSPGRELGSIAGTRHPPTDSSAKTTYTTKSSKRSLPTVEHETLELITLFFLALPATAFGANGDGCRQRWIKEEKK